MAEPRRATSAPAQSVAGSRFLIVEARFYDAIATMLLAGAQAALEAAGVAGDVVTVPGALEIPIALAIGFDAAQAKRSPYQGAVALGCIIRGETYHFEIVANESARALTDLAVVRRLAFGNGILTVENEAQAIARADPAQGDKGGDAARAALALLRLKCRLGVRS
ncbi:MAG: 6,7-dimethyl-8-ribityllumazine synthase [Methylobacteriaceae bacterium]|nr:6,7-dimethyl-8-ribityllumazine synthase [Methylobacteriaceae bacterium]